MRTQLFIFLAFLFIAGTGYSQPCTTPGQTPSTALPVCSSTNFSQYKIPKCKNNKVYVPGCSQGIDDPAYDDRNPFWYKFTCSTSGTLGFHIDPNDNDQDFDWQLFDITGHNPDDVYTDTTLVVAGNWAGSFGSTGSSEFGFIGFNCASETERFAQMPNLIEGHEYLLMISSFTDGENGFTLFFEGGTAVINNPAEPHLKTATQDCYEKITVKLSKKVKCNSLTATGSEFSLLPAGATIVFAEANNCSVSPYFDELTVTLSNTLTAGNYKLIINNGSDGNSLEDDCDASIPPGEEVTFQYNIPQPIFADSIGKLGCSPDSMKIYFPKGIVCSTIAADGSDFIVNGPSAVTVIGAAGNCVNGSSQVVTVRFATPIYTKGEYSLTLKAGTDGTTIIDECNIEMLQQTLTFQAKDTVSAEFNYSTQRGCRFNTLTFSHNGAHDVNSWRWLFNNSISVMKQTHTIAFPASSTNEVQLITTNGTCSDSVTATVTMDNEVKADFEMPVEICPEDPVIVINTSTGQVDKWQWNFGNISSSELQDPAPQYFPQNNNELYYTIKLKVSNNTLSCSDTISKQLHVLNACFIAVPSAFTPNDDGKNDLLYPINAQKATELEFKVYNRWGKLVFSTHNHEQKWDGSVNGVRQPPGIFVWYLRYTHSGTGQKVFQKGTTMLIR
jgi:gliding motility-associated-like protein